MWSAELGERCFWRIPGNPRVVRLEPFGTERPKEVLNDLSTGSEASIGLGETPHLGQDRSGDVFLGDSCRAGYESVLWGF